MRRDNALLFKSKMIERRIIIVLFFKISALFLLLGRLFIMQVFQHKKYLKMSDKNRYKTNLIPAYRGLVFDRHHNLLVTNQTTYQAIFNPSKNIDTSKVLEHFLTLINNPPANKEKFINSIIAQCRKNIKRESIVIKKFLTWKELVKIEFNIEDLPGILTQNVVTRVYETKQLTAHITGYVATPTKQQIAATDVANRQLFMTPAFKIGQVGIEKSQEEKLRGDYGIDILEVDAAGNLLQIVNYKKPQQGTDLITTIDLKLQQSVADILGDNHGCVVVIDLTEGEILSLYSNPSFDPNLFLRGIDYNTWGTNFQQNKTLFNKVINGLYPPGSTFKVVSALTALQNGMSSNFKYNCTGKFKYGNRIFHCNKEDGHGKVDLNQALAGSCNCYFYQIATEIEVNKIAETAKIMGLGEQYNIGIGFESKGIIPTTSWKEAHFNKKWVGGENLNTIIGQGYLQVNPLQLAVMAGRLATGNQLKPKLFFDQQFTPFPQINFSEANMDIVRKGIFSVFSNQKYGILRGYHHPNPKYHIAGKTGTSQIISKNFDKKEALAAPLEYKAHGLFMGYGPYISPRFAVSVVVEHGLQGAKAAGFGRQILYKTIDLLKS